MHCGERYWNSWDESGHGPEERRDGHGQLQAKQGALAAMAMPTLAAVGSSSSCINAHHCRSLHVHRPARHSHRFSCQAAKTLSFESPFLVPVRYYCCSRARLIPFGAHSSRFSPSARHLHCHRLSGLNNSFIRESLQGLISSMQLSARSQASDGGVPGELRARAATDSTTMEQEFGKPGDMGVILLVGVTGGTGSSVVNGLLASGFESSKLRVLTRSPEGAAARNLAAMGVEAIAGDLDDPKSLDEVMRGVKAIYCHATSKDAAKADPAGEVRAERLAKAAASAGVEHIVYNSSGGGGHGISQVEQKHNIENIFKDSGIPTTNLRATMFMEEFWKVYTRPQILKGRFPFSMPSDKPLQLLAVKDMGLAAGIALKEPEEYGRVSLELAGDELTAAQMCEAYSKAQGFNVSHFSPPKFLFWFLNRDLYKIAKFLSEKGYEADIVDCRKRFPGLLTFNDFLALTHWGDASRNYADGFKY